MKKFGVLFVAALTAFAANAQEPAPEAAPADASAPAAEAAPAPADAAAAPAAPADAAAPAEASAPPADAAAAAAPAETSAPPAEAAAAPAPEAASTEAAPAEQKPWKLYAGYDRAHINFLVSNPDPSSTSPASLKARFGGDTFSSNFNRFRGGLRVLDVVGIEAHVGIKGDSGGDPGSVGVSKYYGIYAVPTGVIFDTVEIAAALGYSQMTVENSSASEKFGGVSYGLNMELPLRHFFESLPDIRVGLGGIVYHHDSTARIYGTHFGLRYDFKI